MDSFQLKGKVSSALGLEMIESVIIGSVVRVLDKFTDLLKYRHERRREFFQNVIEPLFNDLMVMHTDYIKMFEDCFLQLNDNTVPLQEIASSLRQRRVVYEGLRIKSRAFVDALKKSGFDEEVKNFLISAAYDIPDGSLGPVPTTPASKVLDKIYSVTGSLIDSPDKSPLSDRRLVEELVISTATNIRIGWAKTCEEYVRVKLWSLK